METKQLTIPVSDSIGTVSGIITIPSVDESNDRIGPRCWGRNESFFYGISGDQTWRHHGMGTLRFNFPFTEQGKKRPDVPAVAEKTIAAVITKAHELQVQVYRSLPLENHLAEE